MCPHASRGPADRSGFTLVEVLVAFVVMATVMGVLYRGVVQTRAGSYGFEARTQAEIVATALLAEFRADRTLRPGSYSGVRDGRRWTLQVAAIDLSAQMPKRENAKEAAGRTAFATPPSRPGAQPEAKAPEWVTQRLTLRVATTGRPLESELIQLARAPAPAPEDARR